MADILIIDTADVQIKRKSDGHLFATTKAQLASIAQSLGINEKVFGGIGNKPLAIIKGQKEITSTFRNAFFDLELLSMTQGIEVKENGTATVYKNEADLKVVDTTGTLSVTITGTPVDNEVTLINEDGEKAQVTLTAKKATVPALFAAEGEILSATYTEAITGNIVEFETDKFPEAYTLEYHTIGYDPETNKVVVDIYIQLDHVVPNGEFEMSLENGSPLAPEITFDALTAKNSKTLGRIIESKRV